MVTSSAQHTAYIIHKLCSLCFSIRALTPIIKTGNLNPLTSRLFHHIVCSNSVGEIKDAKSYFIFKNHLNNDSCKTERNLLANI